jgi:hypothetical protein
VWLSSPPPYFDASANRPCSRSDRSASKVCLCNNRRAPGPGMTSFAPVAVRERGRWDCLLSRRCRRSTEQIVLGCDHATHRLDRMRPDRDSARKTGRQARHQGDAAPPLSRTGSKGSNGRSGTPLRWELRNGDLLQVAERDGFDVLIMSDGNIRHQNRLGGMRIAVFELGTNRWPTLQRRAGTVSVAPAPPLPTTA